MIGENAIHPSTKGKLSNFNVGRYIEPIAVCAFFALLTLAITWPLVPRAGSVISNYHDCMLLIWTLSWEWSALLTHPLNLFNANVYFPFSDTLACADHVLGALPFHGFFLSFGADPIRAYNLSTAVGFWFSGIAMYILVKEWAGSRVGGLIAGCLYTVHPVHLHNLQLVNLSHLEFLPLILLSVHKFAHGGRWRWWWAFLILFCWNFLLSSYIAYMGCVMVLAYGLTTLARERLGVVNIRNMAGAALFAATAFVVLVWFYMPYSEYAGGFESLSRNPGISVAFSARAPGDFLSRSPTGVNLGFALPALLAAGALFWRPMEKSRRGGWITALVLFFTGLTFSMGPFLATSSGVKDAPLPFLFMYRWMPFFSAFRYPKLWAIITTLGGAIAAGYAVAELIGLIKNSRWSGPFVETAVTIALIVFVVFDSIPFKKPLLPTYRWEKRPEYYRWLEREGPVAPRMELPMTLPGGQGLQVYLGLSAGDPRPLINGAPHLLPKRYRVIEHWANKLPDEDAVRFFKALGVKWIMVHENVYAEPAPWKESDISRPSPYGLEAVLTQSNAREDVYKLPFEKKFRLIIDKETFISLWLFSHRDKIAKILYNDGISELVLRKTPSNIAPDPPTLAPLDGKAKGRASSAGADLVYQSLSGDIRDWKPRNTMKGYSREELEQRDIYFVTKAGDVSVYEIRGDEPVDTGPLKGFAEIALRGGKAAKLLANIHLTPPGDRVWRNPEPGKKLEMVCAFRQPRSESGYSQTLSLFPAPALLPGYEELVTWTIPFPKEGGLYGIYCAGKRIADLNSNWYKLTKKKRKAGAGAAFGR